MCLAILVAADAPLTPPYAPEVGGLAVRKLPADEELERLRRVFSKPHAYVVSMRGGCGCEFRHPEGLPRRGLVWLLEWALRTTPEVELYITWDPSDKDPTTRDWTTARELLHWRVFEDGDFLVVHREAEPSR